MRINNRTEVYIDLNFNLTFVRTERGPSTLYIASGQKDVGVAYTAYSIRPICCSDINVMVS